MITKRDLIREIQEDTRLKKSDVSSVIDSFIRIVEESLKDGDSVQLLSFGTFKTEIRKPRIGRNVVKGETLHIPGKIIPVFKPGDRLKRVVTKDI